MSCSKCGCRIVSKLGRSKGLLICADCGHPVQTLLDPAKGRRTALAAVSLAGIMLVGSSVLILDSIHDSQRQGEWPAESSEVDGQGE